MVKPNATAWAVGCIKLLLLVGAAYITLTIVRDVPDWTGFEAMRHSLYALILVMGLAGLLHRPLWRRLVPLPAILMRGLVIVALLIFAVWLLPADFADRTPLLIVMCFYGLLVFGIGSTLNEHRVANLVNLSISLVTLLLMTLLLEWLAPGITASIAEAQRQTALEQRNTAFGEANHPGQADEINTHTSGVQLHSPQVEILKSEPGPAWGELTGWGTSVNTVMHYWLDGVYDNLIEYNSLGFRGPEISYDKPDDVYRIMLVGDSFIEAREVAYEDTIYAQLGALLADATTPDGRRIEVFGVGATGWGTLQSYLYYHHEGQRFGPDLVVNVFIINDVADNYPTAFYPSRDIDFQIGNDSVTIVPEEATKKPASETAIKRLLAIAPPFIAHSHSAQLLVQVFDPPRQSVTIAGDLSKLHPQNYIYVRYPEIDHYPEAWERTRQAYTIWTHELEANGSDFMVLAVDPSVDRISEISTYFGAAKDWVWDVDLPTIRLHEILDPLAVPLIETRHYYEAYAESVGDSPFSALFYVEDGHWNPIGHRITAQLLAEELQKRGIVQLPQGE